MDPPTNMGQYLGCMHRPFEITVDGKLIRGVEYDMEEYLRTAVKQYGEVCLKVTGKTPKLNSAVTPFYPDSPQHNRASIPFKPGKAVICPSCRHTFAKDNQLTPEEYYAVNKIPTKKEKDESLPKGELQSIAASVLMRLMYAARMARWDLLRAISHLACFITTWTPDCDK